MKETNYNVIQGDGWLQTLVYNSPSITYSGSIVSSSPVDLTGASAIMEVRDQPGGNYLAASAVGYSASPSLNNGIVITASAGKLDITITSAQTANFNLPKSAYQIRVTLPGGQPITLLRGWFSVDPSVIY